MGVQHYITPGAPAVPDNSVTTQKIVDAAVTRTKLSATGTPDATKFHRGDDTWAVPVGSGATAFTVVTKTANYTAGPNEFVIVDASGGAVTITFPTAPAEGTRNGVMKVDSSLNPVNLALGGSDVFNVPSGATTDKLVAPIQAVSAQYKASSSIWYEMSTGVPLGTLDVRYRDLALNPQTGTSYTLAVTDDNVIITMTNAAAQTLTFPQNSTAAIPIGASGEIHVLGAGQVTCTQGTGATLTSRGGAFKSAGQYAVLGWRKLATNTFNLTGDLST